MNTSDSAPSWPILLVDDEPLLLEATRQRLEGAFPGTPILTFTDGVNALAATQGKPLGLALLDVDMPRMSGIELAAELRARSPELPIAFLTGTARDKVADEVARVGAVAWLRKPVSGQVLVETVRRHALGTRDAT